MDQGTQDWHEWRNAGIGSSDAPIIMGVSPWTTRRQLWELKTGLVVKREEDQTWVQRRGHEMEPKIRAAYEIRHGFIDAPPRLAELPSLPFIRASLDGYDQSRDTVLEIKAPGRADHETAKGGKLPEKYWPQVQHQLMVTGAKRVDYVSGWEDPDVPADQRKLDLAEVTVLPDRDYCLRLMKEELLFWEMVLTGRPPEMVDSDYRCVNRKEVNAIAERYARLHDEMKKVEAELLAHPLLAPHERFRVKRVRVSKSVRSAPVAYDRLSSLQDVDFEAVGRVADRAVEVAVIGETR